MQSYNTSYTAWLFPFSPHPKLFPFSALVDYYQHLLDATIDIFFPCFAMTSSMPPLIFLDWLIVFFLSFFGWPDHHRIQMTPLIVSFFSTFLFFPFIAVPPFIATNHRISALHWLIDWFFPWLLDATLHCNLDATLDCFIWMPPLIVSFFSTLFIDCQPTLHSRRNPS